MLNNTYSIVFLTVCESGSNTENYTLESSVCALNIHFLICATAFLSLGFCNCSSYSYNQVDETEITIYVSKTYLQIFM